MGYVENSSGTVCLKYFMARTSLYLIKHHATKTCGKVHVHLVVIYS